MGSEQLLSWIHPRPFLWANKPETWHSKQSGDPECRTSNQNQGIQSSMWGGMSGLGAAGESGATLWDSLALHNSLSLTPAHPGGLGGGGGGGGGKAGGKAGGGLRVTVAHSPHGVSTGMYVRGGELAPTRRRAGARGVALEAQRDTGADPGPHIPVLIEGRLCSRTRATPAMLVLWVTTARALNPCKH